MCKDRKFTLERQYWFFYIVFLLFYSLSELLNRNLFSSLTYYPNMAGGGVGRGQRGRIPQFGGGVNCCQFH